MKTIDSNTTPPFEIRFNNLNEIRMGSPYNSCEIEFIGNNKIKLPSTSEWQDRYAWSSDFKHLILVKWDLDNNIPGFRFFTIDTILNKSRESHKIFGLLNNLYLTENKIKFNKFLLDKEKSVQGKLCCNVDEELDLIFPIS